MSDLQESTPAASITSAAASTLGGCAARRERKSRAVNRLASVIAQLPNGVTFTGSPDNFNEAYIRRWLQEHEASNVATSHAEEREETSSKKPELPNDGTNFVVGLFSLNINEIQVSDLKRLRCAVPMDEYTLFKNRKCARVNRQNRTE